MSVETLMVKSQAENPRNRYFTKIHCLNGYLLETVAYDRNNKPFCIVFDKRIYNFFEADGLTTAFENWWIKSAAEIVKEAQEKAML